MRTFSQAKRQHGPKNKGLVGATFTTEAASELKILGLDRHTLGVNGSQVGVLEERDKVS
jgi:hypothetical protein